MHAIVEIQISLYSKDLAYLKLARHEIPALTLVIGRVPKNNCVEFGPVNEWCFDEESWPGPRTGEVSARKGG